MSLFRRLKYRRKWTCPECEREFRAKNKWGIVFVQDIHPYTHETP